MSELEFRQLFRALFNVSYPGMSSVLISNFENSTVTGSEKFRRASSEFWHISFASEPKREPLKVSIPASLIPNL